MALNPRSANRNISPPPIRRQYQHFRTETSLSAKLRILRISAWNVNGVTLFVTPYLRRQPERGQHDIRSCFRTDPRGMARSRKHNCPRQDERAGDKLSLRGSLERLGWPHILCLQEIKIKRGDALTMDAVRAAIAVAVLLPREGVHFNLPCDPHDVKGFGSKVYGVATVVRRSFARAHVETVTWDKEGRIQIIETRDLTLPICTSDPKPSAFSSSKQSPISELIGAPSESEKGFDNDTVKLTIINIYAVNGTSNPWRSPEGSIVGTGHDRKLAVHYELLCEVKCLEDRGFAFVIAGNVNVARNARDGYPSLRTWLSQPIVNRKDFNKKFFSDGLVGLDPGAERVLTSEHSKSYYPRGRDWGSSCDRVDLIIATRALGRLLVDAGICDNSIDRGPSGHCPIWAEFGRELEA
ncbi:DNase I-like protein [Xylaria curta]|nr:DNase I-like protein [Xylaria curta]